MYRGERRASDDLRATDERRALTWTKGLVHHGAMATVVNTHEAKTHLSKLLGLVEKGEEVIIARNGKPIAKLVQAESAADVPILGTAIGRVIFHEGWDDPMSEEELSLFYDSPLNIEGDD
jgi:prevent-host-death family protein